MNSPILNTHNLSLETEQDMLRSSNEYVYIEHVISDHGEHDFCTPTCYNRHCDINIVINRDPTYINVILNYMRTEKILVEEGANLDAIREEAKFYHILSMVNDLDQLIQ